MFLWCLSAKSKFFLDFLPVWGNSNLIFLGAFHHTVVPYYEHSAVNVHLCSLYVHITLSVESNTFWQLKRKYIYWFPVSQVRRL